MNTERQEVGTAAEPIPPTTATEAPKRPLRVRAPRVDVTETPQAYFVIADVPGVPMNAIDVTVEENRLEFSARRTPAHYDGYTPALRQYEEGEYRRAFSMPEAIEREKIHADLRDGVLRITLPKAQPAQPHKVSVQLG